MKITIITATYNCVSTLEQTILSVINQTYDDIEYIIIDGGSTDGTVDIIKKYSDKIAYWVSEKDEGVYYALNKGIEYATGDYIEIIGSDDYFYHSKVIENVVSCIESDTDILSTCCYIVNEKYKMEYYYTNEHAINKENYPGWMIPHGGMFVKKNIMKCLKFDTQFKIAADYDFFLKCYLNNNYKFKFVNMPVYYFSDSGISSNVDKINIENIKIKTKYSLDNNEKKDKQIFNNIKAMIKSSLEFIDCGNVWMYAKGWRYHKCTNKWCRWCNK